MGTYYSSAEVAVPAPEYGYVAPESMNEEYEYGTGFNVQQDNVPGSDEAYAYYASGLIGPSSLQNESVYQDMSADDQHAAYADLSSVPLPSLSSNTKPTQDSGTRAADESDDDYVGIVDEAPQDSYGARVVDQPDYEESPSNAFGAVDLADYEVGAEVTLAQDYEASAPRLSLRPDPATPVDTPVAVLHVGRSEAEAMLRQPSESSGSYVVRKKGGLRGEPALPWPHASLQAEPLRARPRLFPARRASGGVQQPCCCDHRALCAPPCACHRACPPS